MALTQVPASMQESNAQYTGFKNRIINGHPVIFQRGASTAVDSTYFVDRWYIAKVSAGTFTADASSTVPPGFYRSIMATVNTADSSIANNDEFSIRQHIEGYNISDLAWGTANAQPVTLSFWVRSTVTGTYAVAIRSKDSGITYVTTYTISAANTYEYKSVTIQGPTSGTFGQSNDIGFTVIFGLGGGTDFQGTANTWNSGNKWFTSACTQWISNSGAVWNLTGVQLEKGSTATSFDYRPYGTELQLCQRYFENIRVGGYSKGGDGNATTCNKYWVPKRTTPTITANGNGVWAYDGATSTYTSQPWGTSGYAWGVGLDYANFYAFANQGQVWSYPVFVSAEL